MCRPRLGPTTPASGSAARIPRRRRKLKKVRRVESLRATEALALVAYRLATKERTVTAVTRSGGLSSPQKRTNSRRSRL